MPKKSISILLCVLFIAAGAAQAEVSISYSSRGTDYFTMNIADEWRVNVGSETGPAEENEESKVSGRLISAMPNDGVPLWFGMWVPDDLVNIQEAKDHMTTLAPYLLTDAVVTERKIERLNSMEVYSSGGTGKQDGELMDFKAAYLQLDEDSVAIAIYIGPHEATIRYGKQLKQMIHSLQPVTQ